MNKILIISDIHEKKQINGVVTVYNNLVKELKNLGHDVKLITLNNPVFKTISLPTYKEIKWVVNPWQVKQMIEAFKPDHIHIATEGALGFYAGVYCRKKKMLLPVPTIPKYHFTSTYAFLSSVWDGAIVI
jgi:hypothetical protein